MEFHSLLDFLFDEGSQVSLGAVLSILGFARPRLVARVVGEILLGRVAVLLCLETFGLFLEGITLVGRVTSLTVQQRTLVSIRSFLVVV